MFERFIIPHNKQWVWNCSLSTQLGVMHIANNVSV
jgi:hypothetical protein